MPGLRERMARAIQSLWLRRQRGRLLRHVSPRGGDIASMTLSEANGLLTADLTFTRYLGALNFSLLANHDVLLSVDLRQSTSAGSKAAPPVRHTAALDYARVSRAWRQRPAIMRDGVEPSAPGTLRAGLRVCLPAREVPARALAVEYQTDQGPTLSGRQFSALVNSGEIAGELEVHCHLPVGRAGLTHLGALHGDGMEEGRVLPYINRNGYLALAVAREPALVPRLSVDTISVDGGILHLSGHAATAGVRVESARLVALGRKSGIAVWGPASFNELRQATATHFGAGRYLWEASVDFGSRNWAELDTGDNYDLWMELAPQGAAEVQRIRVAKTPYLVRASTRAGHAIRGSEVLVINPYYTFKRKATSVLIERQSLDSFRLLKASTPVARALAKRGRKPIWIIGELPYKAQDNGLHFFRYMRTNHPEIDAYYVIDEQSPELENLRGLGHVLFHHSEEHFRLALLAERFIGTHHPDYLYPTRMPDFRRKATGGRVFLQHGVMGTKWMVPNYGKRAAGFETDLFCVSSEREREYIVEDFGYDPAEVVVTGLPRFDALLAADVAVHARQLLVIPTWRDWLQTDEVFAASQYLEQWSGFLNHPRLRTLAEAANLDIVFCLHPNMQGFTSYFEDAPARIVRQGEIDVQLLMKQSAAMVTDYSSVGFDFSFLGRPVHYFQFDRERFLGRAGSHLDLDAELPGPIAGEVEMLLSELEATVKRAMRMEPAYRDRADRFIVVRDRNHSRRVFEAINAMSLGAHPVQRIAGSEFADRVQGRLRRDKHYFSAMKLLQRCARLLPMDKNLMVFESGLGKQYADSPRYIYEELVRRGDARKKVWIYTGPQRFTDPNTKVIKRLSPQYFWALGRAGYWITNQSFPFYMRRRRYGVYLQTWHGTPLKRMLHDLEEIQGRDPDYVQRAEQATKQWSHLLSPSPYATAVMRSAYGYTGPVLELGYPRNDPLVAGNVGERAEQIRRRLGVDEGQKVVLYAPTFRDNAANGRGRFGFEMPLDLRGFVKRFGENTVLLLRMHVLVQAGLEIPAECHGRVIDVSGYTEIQELYLVSDVLITDYSSVFFDYALLRRPIVFFAHDLGLYRDELRGFYLDYAREMPGPIVETEDALFAALHGALDGELQDGGRREEFLARFAPRDDGSAAARVVEALFESP